MQEVTAEIIRDVIGFAKHTDCGKRIKSKHIDKDEIHITKKDRQKEWFLFSSLMIKEGPDDPKPERLSGRNGKEGKLIPPYYNLDAHSDKVIEMLDHYGLEIVSKNKTFSHQGFSTTIDLECKHTKTDLPAFVQIVTDHDVMAILNEYTGQQLNADPQLMEVVHAKMIAANINEGTTPDYYFFCFSDKDPTLRMVFQIDIEPNRFNEHSRILEEVVKVLDIENKDSGWEALPQPEKCPECPLKENCDSYSDIPTIKTIYY